MATSLYTLTQLQALVYTRLEDNSVFYDATWDLTPIINEALQISNNICGWYAGTVNLISQANQLVYNIPTGMLYPQRIQFEGMQLDPSPITRIGQDFMNWTTQTTAVHGAVARWVPLGITMFAMHPIDSTGGGSIAVTGVLNVPPLINGSDTMPLEDEFVNIVVEYCASRIPLKVGGPTAAQASRIYTSSVQRNMLALTNLRKMAWPKSFVLKGVPVVEDRTQ